MAYLFKLQWDRFSFPFLCSREGTAEHQPGCSCSWAIPADVPTLGQLQTLTFPVLQGFGTLTKVKWDVTLVHIKAAWGILLYVSATPKESFPIHTPTLKAYLHSRTAQSPPLAEGVWVVSKIAQILY